MCDVPICRKGCDPLNGYCRKPNECTCRLGYYGELCNKCIRMIGCEYGYCNSSFQCLCRDGWNGLFCSERNLTLLMEQRPAKRKIFNQNPTEKNFFKPKPDPNPKKKIFSTRPESTKFLRHNSSVQYSNLCRLQNNFWYKSNFKFQYFSEKKLVFKPEPDPISGLSRVNFFSFREPDAGLCYGNL